MTATPPQLRWGGNSLSLPPTQNTQDVGALLRVADRRAAHPGAGVHRLGIAEVEVELVLRPDLAFRARLLQHGGIVERRIAGDRSADQADELRAGLLAGVRRKRMAGLAVLEDLPIAGLGARAAGCGQERGRHDPKAHAVRLAACR